MIKPIRIYRLPSIVSLAAWCLMVSSYAQEGRAVRIMDHHGDHFFFVQGAVNKPGIYRFRDKISPLALLVLAGGLTRDHGEFAYVFSTMKDQSGVEIDPSSYVNLSGKRSEGKKRQSGPLTGSEYEFRRIHLNAVFDNKFSETRYFRSGGILDIPHGDVFFVTGKVSKPGSFPLKDGLTLRQAVLLAHGTNIDPMTGYAILYSFNSQSGEQQELIMSLDAVMNGEEGGIEIHPHDIINITSTKLGTYTDIPLAHLVDTSQLLRLRLESK